MYILIVIGFFLHTYNTATFNHNQYTYYYETTRYSFKTLSPSTDVNTSTSKNNDSTPTEEEPYSFNIITDDISIDILMSTGLRPFIININKNETKLSLKYDSDNEFNSIETWNTPHRHRRRLRQCSWNHHHWCGWWNMKLCRHKHHYYCPPVAPPSRDGYWRHRYKEVGRFIGFYPGKHSMWWYSFYGCQKHCARHFGGLASVHSQAEWDQVYKACRDVLINPKHHNQRDHNGNWRGHACYIGLERRFNHVHSSTDPRWKGKGAFKIWTDGTPVSYTKWQPGEPNNWGYNRGYREDCTELYAFHHGRWNDLTCSNKRSCVCQRARGIIRGKFIGVQGTRTYAGAHEFCKSHYGTELATITTNEENEDVLKLCNEVMIGHVEWPRCWIGLKRPFHEWDDGTNAEEKYENWNPGEPNNWGNSEDCTELLGRIGGSDHRGRWNDINCNAQRYFVCNLQSKVQRMDYHEREEMIAKRLQRHRLRWTKYQQEAHRRKIRKAFFEARKAQMVEMRKRQREQQERMREYYRQMAFSNAMSHVGHAGAVGGIGAYGVGGGFGHGHGGYGSFGAQSAFGNNYLKRRRMKEMILSGSKGQKRQNMLQREQQRKEERKREVLKMEHLKEREIDGDDMFYENEGNEEEEYEELELNENVNPSPHRCVFVNDFGNLMEICLNDDHLDIIKFVEKKEKKFKNYDPLYGDMSLSYTKRESVSYAGYEKMDFAEFDSMKYVHNGNVDEFSLDKVENVQFLDVIEFIYDHNNNHKRQCYNDDQNEYEFCLEFDEFENEMFLYLDRTSEGISFNQDNAWNEVHYIRINNDAEKENERVKKCVNMYHFDRKICVIKQKRQRHPHEEEMDKYDEYRATVKKHESPKDDHDPSLHMY